MKVVTVLVSLNQSAKSLLFDIENAVTDRKSNLYTATTSRPLPEGPPGFLVGSKED